MRSVYSIGTADWASWFLPDIATMVRVVTNGLEDLGSVLGRVIPKAQKVVLDASLLNTQHYKVGIKGKVEKFREMNCALYYISVL